MRRCPLVLVALLVLAFLASPAAGQTAEPWLRGLSFPTNMALAPDGRLFFTEKGGAVRVVTQEGTLQPSPLLTLPVITTGETGLLGIALHPAFADGDPWIYLYLSDPADGMNRVVRVRVDDGGVSAPDVLLTTVPATNAYHNGGDLLFGRDGALYVAVGEAHERERAQDPNDLGGKVLRLDPDGRPAARNPLAETNPVYTLGHRNSFGLCVDPATGDIWETENGPDVDDEVNRLIPGGNYGWPEVTGDVDDERFVDPVSVFPDTVALTGCAWWRDDLLVGSYNDGRVRRIDPETGRQDEVFGFPAGVTDLLVAPDDTLYVATATAIWRVAATDPSGSASPVSSTPSLGPDPMPPSAGGAGDGRAWVALAAAVVLAGGLVARFLAGRSLRGRDRTGEP